MPQKTFSRRQAVAAISSAVAAPFIACRALPDRMPVNPKIRFELPEKSIR